MPAHLLERRGILSQVAGGFPSASLVGRWRSQDVPGGLADNTRLTSSNSIPDISSTAVALAPNNTLGPWYRTAGPNGKAYLEYFKSGTGSGKVQGTAAAWTLTTRPKTLMAILRMPTARIGANGDEALLFGNNANANPYMLAMLANVSGACKVRLYKGQFQGTPTLIATSAASLTLDTWTCVFYTWDGTDAWSFRFLRAAQDSGSSVQSGVSAPTGLVVVGNTIIGPEVAEQAIWSKVLTTAEMQAVEAYALAEYGIST